MVKQINKEILYLKFLYIIFAFFKIVTITTGLKIEFYHIITIVTPIIFYRNMDYFKSLLSGKYSKVILLFISFITLSTIVNFITNKIPNVEADFISIATILLFLPSILYYDKKTFFKELRRINYLIIILTTIGSIISILMYIFNYSATIGSLSFHTYLERTMGYYESKLYGIYYNPNFAAGFVGFSATVIQFFLIDWKNKNNRNIKIWLISISFISNLVFTVLTESLGSAIVVGVSVLAIMYFYLIKYLLNHTKKVTNKVAKNITRVILILVTIILLISLYDILTFMINYKKPGFYYDPIFNFLVSGNPYVQTLGPLTGRTKIYREIIGRSISSPIFGYGLDGSFPIKVVGTRFAHSHNDLLQIVYGYGYPALITFITFIGLCIKNILPKISNILYSLKSTKLDTVYYVAFCMIVAFIFRSQIEITTIFGFGIAPIYFWIMLGSLHFSSTNNKNFQIENENSSKNIH